MSDTKSRIRYYLTTATIVMPPRHFKLYATNRGKELQQWYATVINALAWFKSHKTAIEELLDNYKYEMQELLQLEHYNDVTYLFDSIMAHATSDSSYHDYGLSKVKDIIRSLNDITKASDADFVEYCKIAMKYTPSTVGYFNDSYKPTSETMQLMGKVADIYGENKDKLVLDSDESTALLGELVKYTTEIERSLRKISRVLVDIVEKFKAQSDRMQPRYSNDEKYIPPHETIETLYHCTAFASEIAANGFGKTRPDDRYGLGNLGSVDHTISFTYDMKIARDICRCLKEVCMIVHGKLKSHDILSWIQHEKIDTKTMYQTVGKHGPNNSYNLLDTLEMYNFYLWSTKLRTNPVFGSLRSLVPTFSKVSVEDIGILACQVNMKAEGIEYLKAEHEFRVPPEAVLSVKRIL